MYCLQHSWRYKTNGIVLNVGKTEILDYPGCEHSTLCLGSADDMIVWLFHWFGLLQQMIFMLCRCFVFMILINIIMIINDHHYQWSPSSLHCIHHHHHRHQLIILTSLNGQGVVSWWESDWCVVCWAVDLTVCFAVHSASVAVFCYCFWVYSFA